MSKEEEKVATADMLCYVCVRLHNDTALHTLLPGSTVVQRNEHVKLSED